MIQTVLQPVPRKTRLLACACARLVWDRLEYEEAGCAAVAAAEGYADGLWSKRAMAEAHEAARVAAEAWGGRRARVAKQIQAALRAALWCAVEEEDRYLGLDSLVWWSVKDAIREEPEVAQAMYQVLRDDVLGGPTKTPARSSEWRTGTVVSLAKQMYESRDFSAMPALADALQDAGCDRTDVLDHCRDANGVHVRGCWAVDLVLGKE